MAFLLSLKRSHFWLGEMWPVIIWLLHCRFSILARHSRASFFQFFNNILKKNIVFGFSRCLRRIVASLTFRFALYAFFFFSFYLSPLSIVIEYFFFFVSCLCAFLMRCSKRDTLKKPNLNYYAKFFSFFFSLSLSPVVRWCCQNNLSPWMAIKWNNRSMNGNKTICSAIESRTSNKRKPAAPVIGY